MKELRTKPNRLDKRRPERDFHAEMEGLDQEKRPATTDASIAHKAIRYLRQNGLTIRQGWTVNGKPPADVKDYLDAMIEGCFPTDEDELEEQVIELIEASEQ